ncbi:MAG: hypothetical protein ACI4KF_08555 [Huintestinicola sp.]
MRYEKIINGTRPFSGKHYPMPQYARAAQFASFAALTGYGDAVNETARLTDEKAEIDEDRAAELDMRTRVLIEFSAEQPEITVEHFVPDRYKAGGAYVRTTGCFRWYDGYNGNFVFTDGRIINIGDIYEIKGDLFGDASAEQ